MIDLLIAFILYSLGIAHLYWGNYIYPNPEAGLNFLYTGLAMMVCMIYTRIYLDSRLDGAVECARLQGAGEGRKT